jgi:hypothetical protein
MKQTPSVRFHRHVEQVNRTHTIETTCDGNLKEITGNALVGHLEGISNLHACPNSENEDTVADLRRFPGEICRNVGFKTQKQPIQNAFKHGTPISKMSRV